MKHQVAGRRWLAGVVLLTAVSATAPVAGAAKYLDFTADVGIAPGPVLLHESMRVNATGGPQFQGFEVNWSGTQPPLATAAIIGLGGSVNWTGTGAKSLGVNAVAEGYVTAFDPTRPPPPQVGVIEATSRAHVDAIVTPTSHGYAAGSLMSFELLAPRVHGRLSAPQLSLTDSGLASIHGLFVMFEYFGTDLFGNQLLGGSQARSFEISVSSDTPPHERDFTQTGIGWIPGLQPIGGPPPVGDANPPFQVRNGRSYLAIVELYARASLLPFPTTSGAATPRIEAASSFGSTLHWGGFDNFADELGNPLLDVQVLGDDGVDWSTASSGYAVPLPPSLGLLCGALGLLAIARRRT